MHAGFRRETCSIEEFERSRRRWKNNIKIGRGCSVKWTNLTQDRDKRQAVVKKGLDMWVS
jgi:hypothetical protein